MKLHLIYCVLLMASINGASGGILEEVKKKLDNGDSYQAIEFIQKQGSPLEVMLDLK